MSLILLDIDCISIGFIPAHQPTQDVGRTVTMVTQNHQIISLQELRKNGGKISRFSNQEIQELKENSEILRKVH